MTVASRRCIGSAIAALAFLWSSAALARPAQGLTAGGLVYPGDLSGVAFPAFAAEASASAE